MESENPLTKLTALQVFSYFAHLTKYEQIVPDTVANNNKLQALVTDYFERVPTTSSGTTLPEHLQSLQPVFQHKCNEIKAMRLEEDDDSEQNVRKKLKPSLSEGAVCAALVKIEEDLKMLDQYESCDTISPAVLSGVQNIVYKLDRFLDKHQNINKKTSLLWW